MSGRTPQSHLGEHRNDENSEPICLTRSTIVYSACAAVNSMNLGYDVGISTQVGRLLQSEWDLSDLQREMFVSSINFWAMVGALSAQYVTDRYGRKKTFFAAAIGFIVGVVIMSLSNSIELMLFGRTFVGLAVGVGLAIDPMYIAEVSPASHRGELVTWAEIALNVGIVLGFSTGLMFGSLDDDIEWRVMLLLGAVLPIVMILLLIYVMPESPRWLVMNDREEEAIPILQSVYPPDFDITPVVQDIKFSIEREREAENAVGWAEIFHPSPAIQRMLLVGIGTAVSQQLVGIDAIQYYLLDVLDQSSISSDEKKNLVLIFLGLLKLGFILVGGKLFDKRGRKPLFVASLVGMAFALLMVSGSYFAKIDGTAFTISGLALYLSFFSIGVGPGAWLIPSEVFSLSIRAKAMSLATFFNRLAAFFMSASFLSIKNVIGWGGFFLMLCVIALLTLAFLMKYLPETKGRSLEEMVLFFAEITGDQRVIDAERLLSGNDARLSSELVPKAKNGSEII